MIMLVLAAQIAPPPIARSNVSRPPVVVKQEGSPIDFANMPVETLIQIVMQESAAEASQDLREEMEEMRKIADRKKEARELLQKMAQERSRLDGSVRRYFEVGGRTKAYPRFDDWLKNQSIQMPKVDVDQTSGQASLVSPGGFAGADAPPAPTEARTRLCVARADEDDCVIRAMQARLQWLRGRSGR